MADPPVRQAISIDISDEGLAATHPLTIEFPRPVAPAQAGSEEHNSLRDFLVVVGCAMFPDVTFQFDSSLIGPQARAATRRLALFREQLQDFEGLKNGEAKAFPPIALFGHADPVGQIPYNSRLSARRALCVYGMLLRRVAIWENLFNDKSLAGDIWGDPEFDTMLDEVGFPPELPKGSADDVKRREIRARLKRSAGDRGTLFLAYMNAVCVKEKRPGEDEPFVLQETDFLERGQHPEHRGSVQGCGEFNPVLILSTDKTRRFERSKDKQERDAANEPNRRVLAFLFKPGTRIVPEKWPCPTATHRQPETVCRNRLWKDHDKRLAADETSDREFKKTADTFGCRFYHGIAQNSPCEATLKLWVIRIGFNDALEKDAQGSEIEDAKGRTFLTHPVARRRYVVETGLDPGTPIIRGRTDDQGGLRIPVFDERTTMRVRLDVKSPFDPKDQDKQRQTEQETPEEEFLELVVEAGDLAPREASDGSLGDRAVRQRLSNLGYGPPIPVDLWTSVDRRKAISGFQQNHKLNVTGEADESTIVELRKVHGS